MTSSCLFDQVIWSAADYLFWSCDQQLIIWSGHVTSRWFFDQIIWPAADYLIRSCDQQWIILLVWPQADHLIRSYNQQLIIWSGHVTSSWLFDQDIWPAVLLVGSYFLSEVNASSLSACASQHFRESCFWTFMSAFFLAKYILLVEIGGKPGLKKVFVFKHLYFKRK